MLTSGWTTSRGEGHRPSANNLLNGLVVPAVRSRAVGGESGALRVCGAGGKRGEGKQTIFEYYFIIINLLNLSGGSVDERI